MDVETIFFKVDNVYKGFSYEWKKKQITGNKQNRKNQLSDSEIMTIIILFHQSNHRHFKGFYTKYVMMHYKAEFPNLVSYLRFVTLMKRVLVPLCAYMNANKGLMTYFLLFKTRLIHN